MTTNDSSPTRIDEIADGNPVIAAADQQPLSHCKAQEASLLRRLVDLADEIGEHAIDAVVDDVDLLKIVMRQQEIARQRGDLR